MSAPEIVVITPRQRELEELAREIFNARPGTSMELAKQLASVVIDELDALQYDWNLRSALAYALQTPRTLAA